MFCYQISLTKFDGCPAIVRLKGICVYEMSFGEIVRLKGILLKKKLDKLWLKRKISGVDMVEKGEFVENKIERD
jgi:hypothetical protein